MNKRLISCLLVFSCVVGSGIVSAETAGAPSISDAELQNAINAAVPFFRQSQGTDGSWTTPMRTSSIQHACMMIFLYEALNLTAEKKDRISGLMNYIWSQQDPQDGGFGVYPRGAISNDLSVMAYLAAKIGGEPELSDRMSALERSILRRKSVQSALLAKPYLIYFRLAEPPPIPPGTLWDTLKLDSQLPWIKSFIYPVLYLIESHASKTLDEAKVPNRIGLRSLGERSQRYPIGEKDYFNWILSRFNEDGTFFDYAPPTVLALLTLLTQGDEHASLIQRAVGTLESFQVDAGPGKLYMSPGLANVGETVENLWAFSDMGFDLGDPMVRKAEEFVRVLQNPANGGFGFSSHNQHNPDSDMTGSTVYVLTKLKGNRTNSVDPRMIDALHFVLKNQNVDGGFGTWEKDKHPIFWDLVDKFTGKQLILDNSIIEHTARIALALAEYRDVSPEFAIAYKRALGWLLKKQNPNDGSYQGTWFVDYIFSTSMVLHALSSAESWSGADKELIDSIHSAVGKGLNFILPKQSSTDGGFSESPRSFDEARSVPLAHSSPAQTGLITVQLLGLMQNEGLSRWPKLRPAVDAAIRYLVGAQDPADGRWHDPTWSAVLYPKEEYLRYPYIQEMAPLHAIGFYRNLIGNTAASAAAAISGANLN